MKRGDAQMSWTQEMVLRRSHGQDGQDQELPTPPQASSRLQALCHVLSHHTSRHPVLQTRWRTGLVWGSEITHAPGAAATAPREPEGPERRTSTRESRRPPVRRGGLLPGAGSHLQGRAETAGSTAVSAAEGAAGPAGAHGL